LTINEEFKGFYRGSDVEVKGKVVMQKGKVVDEEWYQEKLSSIRKGVKGVVRG